MPTLEELLPKTEFEKPRAPMGMKKFTIFRTNDETGVSGTGIIIQGTLFADGTAAIQWLCPPAAGDTQVKKWESFLDVHVRKHPVNHTIITWEDGTQQHFAPEAVSVEEIIQNPRA
jgi:hypothetical protein